MSSEKKKYPTTVVLSSEERAMLQRIADHDLRDLSHELKFLIYARHDLLASQDSDETKTFHAKGVRLEMPKMESKKTA